MVRQTAAPLKSLKRIHKTAAQLTAPKDLFAGLTLREAFAPDNILFFLRTHSRAFRPEGVSDNFHHRYVLVVVLQKEGPARVGNQTHILAPGEAVLIFPNQFHHFMDVEKGELGWLFITFELGDAAGIERLRNRPRRLDKDALQRIENILRLNTGHDQEPANHALEVSFELSKVLSGMLQSREIPEERMNIHSTDDVRDVILEKINTVVRKNLDRQITIADLAEEMGYSVSYLRALFRDRLGISLGKYIRESRLSRAAQLLQENRGSITDIARQTGFESLFAFSRAFKNAYGVSPKAYSKLVRRGD